PPRRLRARRRAGRDTAGGGRRMTPLDPDTIARLAQASVVELGHRLHAGMPNYPTHPPFLSTPYYRFGDFELAGGQQGTNELIVMSGHSGTHIDAFAHAACNGVMYGGHATADAYDG